MTTIRLRLWLPQDTKSIRMEVAMIIRTTSTVMTMLTSTTTVKRMDIRMTTLIRSRVGLRRVIRMPI